MPAPLYERMVAALEAAGYETTLSGIGRLFDVWPNAVAKWRDGIALPEQAKLFELIEITGCNPVWLLTGEGERVGGGKVDDLTKELLRIWATLDDQARQLVLDFVKYQAAKSGTPSDPG